MGILVDMDGDADKIQTTVFSHGMNGEMLSVEKKIYPNDLCLRESGRKYKKCCGKYRK